MLAIQRTHKLLMGFLAVILLLALFVPTQSAFAANDAPINPSNINLLCAKMETTKTATFEVDLKAGATAGETGAIPTKVFTCGTTGLLFDQEAFDNGTEKSRKRVMKELVTALQTSGMEDQHQQVVIDSLSAKDSNVSRLMIPLVMDSTNADLFTALKWLGPLLPIVRVLFGVGAIVIVLLLVASTIVDLCFIGLPVMRESMNDKSEGSGKKIPFVSSDAVSVVQDTESSKDSSGGYKNAFLTYFIRRSVTYIILSICLLYLVLGELSGLISWLLSLGDGIVGGS